MLVGRGVIANRFLDFALQSSAVIFAGNIHDSTIQDETLLREEETTLLSALSQSLDATFVYFSSCSVLDPNESGSPYVKHKLHMEQLVQKSGRKYLIFRLPQVLGFGNEPSSLVNFLVDAIYNEKPFKVWKNAEKNLIDIDDVYDVVKEILSKGTFINQIVNIASPLKTPVLELVRVIEIYFKRKANYELIERPSGVEIDSKSIHDIFLDLKIKFDSKYLERSIHKYYRHLVTAPYLLSVVVPTFNEEHGIEEFYRRTKAVLRTLEGRFDHEIIFVNDFSTDLTYQKLEALAEQDSRVKLINFSRNFGNQIGITAGIDYAKGDIAVIIDDDLQDPPEIMINFISYWTRGFKVVYGVRPKRTGVNFFFKLLAKIYYRVIGSLSETKIPNDTGDFRLIDRIVIEKLKLMKEENRYYRGMVAWVGFKQFGCLYDRDKRYAGVSTFSFKKYINFALNGLTSFTDKPLYFSSLIGFLVTISGFILAICFVLRRFFDPTFSIPGWTSLMAVAIFFGGIQLLSIGVVGIYLSKVFREVKGRPLYIIESTANIEEKN